MVPCEKTLYSYFEEYAAERGGDLFLSDEHKSYTAAQAFRAVRCLAKQMQDGGVEKGVFVAVTATRTVESILIFYALQFIGGVAVMYGPHEEMKEDIKISDGSLYICGKEIKLSFGITDGGEIIPTDDVKEAGTIIFTSGSMGGKKAVRLSQYNFINNSLDTEGIGGYRPDDVNILIVPIFHVFGLALIMTAVVTKHSIFVPERIDTEYILDCMEKYRVTRLNGVPSMYLGLAERVGQRKLHLNCGLIGGGPCTKEQFLNIEKKLGITLIPVYGMSECIGISCGSYTDDRNDRCDSVGRIYSMNTVKVEDDGEILVKSPALAQGYLDGETTDTDGWLHTGDLGYLDEKGFLHITGRKKDIVIRNGNNLPVAEIERKILSLPQVKDACVVGIPDKAQGEVPCAMIVSGTEVDLSTVLSKIEMPVKVIYSKAIPLTSSCKPDKQTVRKMFFSAKMGISKKVKEDEYEKYNSMVE